ncbi:GNAT family N-acetyltransferase [Brevibacterium sp. BRM-1]|uniref:GNAT family N-acetyltransferase n=1 Tax=Brevibacterium sp. BRM-1 TaxID=2999062 RepID=UPI002280E860|nr:GNAT family N-acetyltransferase [Brevibacterium sp. BRM-1]WAL40205.1 GNAT family N-acetyltransferase [Brevibacterium sp. BRM-1]
MLIRPFSAGDDLALGEVFHDAATPAEHMERGLFRPASDGGQGEPALSRCVVAAAEDPDILVGAGAIAASPAHPYRAWSYVEVAAEERGRGLGRGLFDAVREEVRGTELDGLPLRTRVAAGSIGFAAAEHAGFSTLFTIRVVRIEALALGALGADRLEDFAVTATGSVELTKAFAAWYAGVNRADPAAPMSLGQVNNRFLSEAAGAYGAALLRDGGEVSAFAVSYAQPEVEAPTELTLGAVYDGTEAAADPDPRSPQFQRAMEDAGALLARLSTDTAVIVEVTDEMPAVSALVDGLIEAGQASVEYAYATLGD